MNFSIVVPAYNNEAVIQQAVSEIIRNIKDLAHEFEIIVVDDGSRDKTFRQTIDLRRHHPQVMIIRHSENLGTGAALKTGIENARYELIVYVPFAGRLAAAELAAVIAATQTADIVLGFQPDCSAYSWRHRLKLRVITRLSHILFGRNHRGFDRIQVWNRRIFSKITLASRGIFLLEEILIKAVRRGFSVTELDAVAPPGADAEATAYRLLPVISDLIAVWRESKGTGSWKGSGS